MTHPAQSARPFAGAWRSPDWPDDPPAVWNRKRGRRLYQIAMRIEPAGDLVSFGDALGKALGVRIDVSPEDDDRSVFAIYYCAHKSAQRALSSCDFEMRRMLKKTGREIARLSYDVCEADHV